MNEFWKEHGGFFRGLGAGICLSYLVYMFATH